MTELYRQKSPEATDELYALACGPDRPVRHFSGCIINGQRFHTKDRDARCKSQNSGLFFEGGHNEEAIDFYGILTDIVELQYIKGCRVVLFECHWFNSEKKRKTMQHDGYLTSINITNTWYGNDAFVLASQAKQVFYLNDTKLGKNWRVVQKFQPQSVYDVPEKQSTDAEDKEYAQVDVYWDSKSAKITILDEVVDREVEEILTRADVDEGEDVYVDSAVEEEEDMAEDKYNEEDDTLNEYDDDDKEEEEQGDDEDSDDDYGL